MRKSILQVVGEQTAKKTWEVPVLIIIPIESTEMNILNTLINHGMPTFGPTVLS